MLARMKLDRIFHFEPFNAFVKDHAAFMRGQIKINEHTKFRRIAHRNVNRMPCSCLTAGKIMHSNNLLAWNHLVTL